MASNHLQVLRETFGFNDWLNEKQEKGFDAIASGKKNVVISNASGSGKSLCFQLYGKLIII